MKIDNVATFAKQRRDRKAQGNARQPKTPKKPPAAEPTPERRDKNESRPAGMATQIKAVIDTLFETDRLTTSEYVALNYYSEQANAAERSPIKSNLDRTVPSGGDRPISLVCPYKEATERMQRQMGFASRTAHAVTVDNYTLTQWAIEIYGGRENGKGRIVPRRDDHVKKVLELLKQAARRIVI